MDALTPQTRSPGLGRIGPYLVAIGLTTAALWILLPLPLYAVHGDLHFGYWKYNAGALALTYFETGFARRELVGTLVRLLNPDPMIAAVILQVSTNFALAAALILLVGRSRSTMPRRIILALAALVILWRLDNDVGRADALIMLLGVAAAICAVKERWIIASIALSVAMFVHETGVIVLLPLLATICVERSTWRSLRSRRGAVAIAIFVGALLLYMVSLAPPDRVGEIARHIHAEIASHTSEGQATLADVAIYFTLSGTQGLRSIQCEISNIPNYSLELANAIVLTILFGLGLRSWKRWRSLLPILAWVIGLSLIGTDIGRWATFALFSILILALLEDERQPVRIRMPMIFLAVTGFALMSINLMALGGILAPIPLMDSLALFDGKKSLGMLQALTYCDPDWRTRMGF